MWRGKFEETLQWAEKSLRLGQEYGRPGNEGYLRLAIGFSSLLAGNYEKAREELTLGLERVKEIDSYGVGATIHYALGCLALVEKSYKQAETEFFESYSLYQQVQDNFLGLALSALGYVSYFRNDVAMTRHFLREALKNALELKDYIHLITSLPVAALFLTRIGKTRRALQVWEAARSQPYIANSRWDEEVVGQVIQTAASVLTPDELETARSLGRETSLWEMAEALFQEIELQA